MKKYLLLSLCFHAAMIPVLFANHPLSTRDDALKVIEVSVVKSISVGGRGDREYSSEYRGKAIVLCKPPESLSLGEIAREESISDPEPDLPSSVITAESPYREGPIRFSAEAKEGIHSPRGLQYEINLWRSSVQRIVETRIQDSDYIPKQRIPLQTTWLLMVSRSGELLQEQLLKSSGNDLFDNSVQASLEEVGHLPPPPTMLVAGSESIDVTMSFTCPLEN